MADKVLEFDYPIDDEPQRDTITLFWNIDILMEYLNHENPCSFSYQKTVEKIERQKSANTESHQEHPSGQTQADGGQMRFLW